MCRLFVGFLEADPVDEIVFWLVRANFRGVILGVLENYYYFCTLLNCA